MFIVVLNKSKERINTFQDLWLLVLAAEAFGVVVRDSPQEY